MSISKKLFIAFCEDNRNIAEDISKKLTRVGYKFELLSSAEIKDDSNLVDQMMTHSYPGLLLISDNFLRSKTCMQKMLYFLNNREFSNIQTIIIDGRYPSKQGDFELVETVFDRVSSVIKYMNFWQEQYLDLRKEKRSIAPTDLEVFEINLDKVKSISAEIGDFLRILRTKKHHTFNEFAQNKFEVFFNRFGDETLYKKYQSIASNDPVSEKTEKDPDLSQIPGMDLLKQAAEKEIVMPVLEEKVAEIDVENVENISSKIVEPELNPVAEVTSTEVDLGTGTIKQPVNTPSITNEENKESTISFEQQVEQIVEELSEEELLENKGSESERLDDQFTELYEEAAEDITSDFDPMIETPPTKSSEESLNEKVDKLIFEASNMIENGKINEASIHLEKAINLQPRNNGARYMYAMVLYNYKEDYANACLQLQKVVEFDDQNAEAFEHLGKIAEFNNDFKLAKEYYEKVVALEPNTFGIYYKLGLITSGFFMDKKKKAFKYFKKAIKQDKNNIDAHYRLGVLYYETFLQPKKALKHFRKVLKLDSKHAFVNYDLALLYNETGDHKKAAQFYKLACKVNPELKTPENDLVFSTIRKENNESVSLQEENMQDEASKIPIETSLKDIKLNKEPGKIVFITGATAGIGKATAEIFAKNGCRLILNGRRSNRLENLQKEFLDNFGVESTILPFDVRNLEDVKKAIKELDSEWSQIDILINNAGLAKGKAPIHEGNIDHWETMIDTNIKGLLYLTRAIAPHMVKRRSGHIINVCSSAGHEVYPDGNVYCATKFAVDALTKSMRLDLHKHNIRVGQVSPGHVEETEFAYVRHEDEERAKIYNDFQPLKSSDVAEVIYFMATAPNHVNIQDVQMMGTQQASNIFIDRSGR